jgi:SagB-type dehydrogenase family enzyme
MTAEDVLTTSPMLFGYRGRSGRLASCDARTGRRFRIASGRAAEIATSFLEPRSVASAQRDGFTREELQEAVEAGILISDRESESVSLWERNGWSRAAFLTFSQMNIPFREFEDSNNDRETITARRRDAVEDYGGAQRYPHPRPLASGTQLELPSPLAVERRLSALTSRRSVRAFSPSPPAAEQLAGVLHAATADLRTIAAARATGGDPVRLLNSHFTFAHLFVVVQAVEGIPRGVFEYDYIAHRLVEAAEPPTDEALAAAIHGQRWVLGTGFVVFVVADLRGLAWLYRHSRAYLHVLIQVGELGQELLIAATELGLGGWTSPAVHESRTAELLGLHGDGVEPLSLVKLGRPLRKRARGTNTPAGK